MHVVQEFIAAADGSSRLRGWGSVVSTVAVASSVGAAAVDVLPPGMVSRRGARLRSSERSSAAFSLTARG